MKQIPTIRDRTEAATRVPAIKLESTPNSGVASALRERRVQSIDDPVEVVVAPAAIERALSIYQQLQTKDPSVIVQARKILTTHIYGLVDQGEQDEHRLTVGGLTHLKAIERDHSIRSANVASKTAGRSKTSFPNR